MSYKRVLLLASLSCGFWLNASAASWDEKYYNPAPDAKLNSCAYSTLP